MWVNERLRHAAECAGEPHIVPIHQLDHDCVMIANTLFHRANNNVKFSFLYQVVFVGPLSDAFLLKFAFVFIFFFNFLTYVLLSSDDPLFLILF